MTQLENHQLAKSQNPSIGVVGAGQMGHGIAHVMLRAGHHVILLDTSQSFVQAGAKRIIKGLARDVEKARLTDEQRLQAHVYFGASAHAPVIGPNASSPFMSFTTL